MYSKLSKEEKSFVGLATDAGTIVGKETVTTQ